MLKELQTIEFIKEILGIKTAKNLDEIYKVLQNLSKKSDFNSLYILNYLYKFICSDEVAKRKSGAREFEDFLAVLFGGVIADNNKRKNISISVPNFFENVQDKVASNKREKADLIFDNFSVSLKTLIPSNKEINMGSFEKTILFDGLGLQSFLTERKNEANIGLGSVTQLNNLIDTIKKGKNYDKFVKKFDEMVKFIYAENLIVAIKSNKQFEFYFFSNGEFYEIFKEFALNQNITNIVNRWEGNSIRIDREILLENCKKKVVMKFDKLNDEIITLINKFDLNLHKNYASYFNKDLSAKQRIFDELNANFEIFKDKL